MIYTRMSNVSDHEWCYIHQHVTIVIVLCNAVSKSLQTIQNCINIYNSCIYNQLLAQNLRV